VQGGLLLNIVIGKRAPVIELLAGEDEALLVRRNPLLVLNLALDIDDTVRRLHLKGEQGHAGEGLHKDLHHLKPTNDLEEMPKHVVCMDVIQFRTTQHRM
jgi:hypothetical protein